MLRSFASRGIPDTNILMIRSEHKNEGSKTEDGKEERGRDPITLRVY